ncbi:MAG: hypothetical protein JO212_10810 [Acetobacteraceae bacterium]|nr:hypothetical protein [Acetobacteraceae bacterium]
MQKLFLGMGVASALVGGFMCLSQRHLKRMLAFSTISHTGILLIGVAVPSLQGLAGMMVYLAGHGLAKGALFMVAGIFLATRASVDEIGLRGLGRDIWPAGIAMALGAVILGGMPYGLMDEGARLVDTSAAQSGDGWVAALLILGAALTGGAVLRAAGRIFLGWGEVPGEEEAAPTEEEQEKANRPLWLMLLPCAALLGLALLSGKAGAEFVAKALHHFVSPDTREILGMASAPAPDIQIAVSTPEPHPFLPWLAMTLSLGIALFDLSRAKLPGPLVRATQLLTGPLFRVLNALHSGLIGDYVMWIAVGLALFVAVFALA